MNAKEFKAYRKGLGLKNQQAVADVLGVPRATVRGWEGGRNIPSLAISCLQWYARALEIAE